MAPRGGAPRRSSGRSLRSVVDLESLGPRTILIDCDVIQADGGTRTASITGAFVALVDALGSLRRAGAFLKLPIKDCVAATSVGRVGGEILLDITYDEDSRAQGDMNVVMTGKGEFVEVQGTGEGGTFSQADLLTFLQLAKTGIQQTIQTERQILKDLL